MNGNISYTEYSKILLHQANMHVYFILFFFHDVSWRVTHFRTQPQVAIQRTADCGYMCGSFKYIFGLFTLNVHTLLYYSIKCGCLCKMREPEILCSHE